MGVGKAILASRATSSSPNDLGNPVIFFQPRNGPTGISKWDTKVMPLSVAGKVTQVRKVIGSSRRTHIKVATSSLPNSGPAGIWKWDTKVMALSVVGRVTQVTRGAGTWFLLGRARLSTPPRLLCEARIGSFRVGASVS